MNLLSANQHVVLKWVESPDEGFGPGERDFVRILSDGTLQSGRGGLAWRVPAGQAFVITDVDWEYVHPEHAAAAGKIVTLRLFIENLATFQRRKVFESTITLSSRGEGGVSEAMATGFVVSSKARIHPDIGHAPWAPPGLEVLFLRGYLTANE